MGGARGRARSRGAGLGAGEGGVALDGAESRPGKAELCGARRRRASCFHRQAKDPSKVNLTSPQISLS